MFSNVPSWQHPTHTQGWQRTSRVKSSLPRTMGKRGLKQKTNKSVYKYAGLKWVTNLTNLALGLMQQPFLVLFWAAEVSHVLLFQESSVKADAWAAQSSNQLMAQQQWPHAIFEACKSLVQLMAPSKSTGIPRGFLSLGPTRQGWKEWIWNHCLSHARKHSQWNIHYNVTNFFHKHRT